MTQWNIFHIVHLAGMVGLMLTPSNALKYLGWSIEMINALIHTINHRIHFTI